MKPNKKTAGITLMELIVVLAVIAIIGAIVVPNLFGIADRARLRGDIQSTIVLRNAVELYTIERSTAPGTTIDTVLSALTYHGYITQTLSPNSPQTTNATWVLSGGQIYLQLPTGIDIEGLTSAEQNVLSPITN